MLHMDLSYDTANKIKDELEKRLKDKTHLRILTKNTTITPAVQLNLKLEDIKIFTNGKRVTVHIIYESRTTEIKSEFNPKFYFENDKVTIFFKNNFSEEMCYTYIVTGEKNGDADRILGNTLSDSKMLSSMLDSIEKEEIPFSNLTDDLTTYSKRVLNGLRELKTEIKKK